MSTKICSVQACVKKEITQCNTTRRDIFTGFGQVNHPDYVFAQKTILVI